MQALVELSLNESYEYFQHFRLVSVLLSQLNVDFLHYVYAQGDILDIGLSSRCIQNDIE